MALLIERNTETSQRPTWAEIDLNHLAANFNQVKQRVGSVARVLAIVKANAYGHGAVQCARRLVKEGAEWFGVAIPEEGIELRASGIGQPILVLGGFWEGQASLCIQQRLTPVVYRLDMMAAMDQAARDAGTIVDVHVKIDTGLGRLGVRLDQLSEFLNGVRNFPNVRIDGLMTHFAAADDMACQPLTTDQIKRFHDGVAMFRDHGIQPAYIHLANSAAIYAHKESWGNMVRPGGVLYGLWRDVLPEGISGAELGQVMSIYTRISLLKRVPAGETLGYGCTFEASRESLIATLPIGYHDGYMRGLSNRANVIVRGTYAPVVGRVSMDLTLIDVTNVPDVALNDRVILIGTDRDNPRLSITVEDHARIAGTLSYEVVCGIGQRVPHLYV
ncbi:MAG TPA: alanine racemase [Pyrinomonadaceae bacterium]